MLRRVVLLLEHHFPSTLKDYEHFLRESEYSCSATSRKLCKPAPISDRDTVRLLSTARNIGLQILMPAAFLLLSEASIMQILEEGSDIRQLSQTNFVCLLKGQRKLYRIAREEVFVLLYSNPQDLSSLCKTTKNCNSARHDIVRDHVEVDAFGTLSAFTAISFDRASAAALCRFCKEVFKSSYTDRQGRAWETLPAQFDLPSWEEMRRTRDELLSS